MIQKRKLIEVALPLEAINVAASHEKSVPRHGHPATLHLWWARRPLAACRAVLFASLVDDPSSAPERFPTRKAVEDERTRLFGIIERLVQWENTTNEAVLAEARAEIRRSTGGHPPPVLDPFCGGGSILLEAQRLGLEVDASDLNPVAVLITKALVEIPPRFAGRPPVHPDARRSPAATGSWNGATGLAEDVRRYGEWVRDEAERQIGHLYPKARLPKEHGGDEATVVAWLWARTVTCPNPACRAAMPLVRSFVLSTKIGREARIDPIVDRERMSVQFVVRTGRGSPSPGTVGRNGARCLVCDTAVTLDHVATEGRSSRMGARLMAVVAEGRKGRVFLPADEDHERAAREASPRWAPETELPDQALGFRVQRYGMRRHRDLFTQRQLVALTTISDLIAELASQIKRDALNAGVTDDGTSLADGGAGATAYGEAVSVYLACALSKLSDWSSSLCTWIPQLEGVGHTFNKQTLSMVWDYTEVNVFSRSVGNVSNHVAWVSEAVASVPAKNSAVVRQIDAASGGPARKGLVATDPPYYDNIGYADLSDFFYIWLRPTLKSVLPDLFKTVLTPKADELVASPSRFGGDRAAADTYFEHGLRRAFIRMKAALHSDFPLTLFYAFKQVEDGDNGASGIASTGWETMLEGLIGSGFALEGTWPMRTERASRTRNIASNALASSIVLVCRPRRADAGITSRRDFVSTLKGDLPEALRVLQHGSIAPVDLAQASIGPGMAIFSRYERVLEPDGSTMGVRSALALINEALDEILAEQEGEFDADTRWAIAWYEQFGLDENDSGRAILLSQAKNTSLDGLRSAGIVDAHRGKTRLLPRREYSIEWDPATDKRIPVWEATQRLVHTLLTDGEAEASDLLSQLGGLGDRARDLAYHLYQIAERKGWTDEALAYNALVVAWPDLVRQTEASRSRGTSQVSLGLES